MARRMDWDAVRRTASLRRTAAPDAGPPVDQPTDPKKWLEDRLTRANRRPRPIPLRTMHAMEEVLRNRDRRRRGR
jgi:hypothetical protein